MSTFQEDCDEVNKQIGILKESIYGTAIEPIKWLADKKPRLFSVLYVMLYITVATYILLSIYLTFNL